MGEGELEDTPPQKRRMVENTQLNKEHNPETKQQPFRVVRKEENSTEQHRKTAAAATTQSGTAQQDKTLQDGTVTIKTLRDAWNMPPPKPTAESPTTNAASTLRVMEMLETTHDQAARDVFAESQKSHGETHHNSLSGRTQPMPGKHQKLQPMQTTALHG